MSVYANNEISDPSISSYMRKPVDTEKFIVI